MGTKEVLVQTKALGCGTECHLYRTVEQFREELPRRLATGATRVLKQYRGHGGFGVYRVAMKDPPPTAGSTASASPAAIVHTQHARFGSAPKDMPLGEFMTRLVRPGLPIGWFLDPRSPTGRRAALSPCSGAASRSTRKSPIISSSRAGTSRAMRCPPKCRKPTMLGCC